MNDTIIWDMTSRIMPKVMMGLKYPASKRRPTNMPGSMSRQYCKEEIQAICVGVFSGSSVVR